MRVCPLFLLPLLACAPSDPGPASGDGGDGTSDSAGSNGGDGSDGGDGADGGEGGDGGDGGSTPDCPEGLRFCDVAEAAGLHTAPPAYGRGVVILDIDDDGWEDLWQTDSGTGFEDHPGVSRAWRNLGDGQFAEWDLGLEPAHMANNWAGVWHDLDADGDRDLLLANGGYHGSEALAVYRNDLPEGGAMVPFPGDLGLPTEALGWWTLSGSDFDGDGRVDLAITATGKKQVQGTLRVLQRTAAGGFVDATAALGLPADAVWADADLKNPVWFDYDNDGDPDLFLSSMEHEAERGARLWRNDGDRFTDVTGDALGGVGAIAPVFTAAAADFDQDGWMDLYLGRWFEQDFVARNLGNGQFELWGPEIGLDMETGGKEDTSLPVENTMGLTVGDLNLDGYPDVIIGPGYPYDVGHALVYCHTGAGLGFARCSDEFAADFAEAQHHGVALGDVDKDGDVDVFWNVGGRVGIEAGEGPVTRLPRLFLQEGPVIPAATVKLRGSPQDPLALGARLRLDQDGGRSVHAWVAPTQGFQSQGSPWQLLPLGEQGSGTLHITWPDGRQSSVVLGDGERVEIPIPD